MNKEYFNNISIKRVVTNLELNNLSYEGMINPIIRNDIIHCISNQLFNVSIREERKEYTTEYSVNLVVATPEKFYELVRQEAFRLYGVGNDI